MNLVACFPGKYIQGSGAILQLERLINQFGNKAVILASPTAQQYLPEALLHPPQKSRVAIETFHGECCEEALESLTARLRREQATVVIGMGGGKAIDTAKIAADRSALPVIIVPTIASTDAPCSGCAVLYSHDGVFDKVLYQRMNPSVVLVDMDIIAQAPVRFLVAGMGDALATWFEARSCRETSSVNECGGLSTMAGMNLARLCYDLLLEKGGQAKLDNEAQVVTDALSQIAEANILLSGIGFESGGLASAHAIHNGLTILPETHAFYHGEKVTFGLLSGLFLNGSPQEEILEVYRFCQSIGLPITLSAIGITDHSRNHLMPAARKSVEEGSSIHHENRVITADKVYESMLQADGFGRQITA